MDPSSTIDDVTIEQIRQVFRLLREELPRVLAANRFFEEHTGFHNEAGNNNLVDALSHLATLVEQAKHLSPTEQAQQVAHLEDHLRRSMMEAFEQVLKYRIGDIAELWDEYILFVLPETARGVVPGVVPEDKIAAQRDRLRALLEEGRSSKTATDWSEWQRGTDKLVEACEVSEDLLRDLKISLAASDWRHLRRRDRLINNGAVAFGAVGVVIAILAVVGIL